MLSRSIPQYDIMRKSVVSLVKSVIEINNLNDFKLLDIGCSDGLMIKALLEQCNNGKYLGIDVSEPMLNKARALFQNEINDGAVTINNCDLRNDFPKDEFDFITSVLSIQFTPIEYRQDIIQNIYDNLSDGGVFIMIEKVLGNTAMLNKLFVKEYYSMKSDHGYTDEQIERKRLSLEGVLVPVTNKWNVDLLNQVGFKQVDTFWRWMNFCGYIAIK